MDPTMHPFVIEVLNTQTKRSVLWVNKARSLNEAVGDALACMWISKGWHFDHMHYKHIIDPKETP
jgi:hypothetical protein